ncbi:hypothetical protein V6N13_065707 [Hibiscus sabdariffa]|uniref:Uncharacterized protein n=1 Tax=Hibiscus sabdariffa TaxID=183260 RepID=A0ABR2QQ63_9ROSI
MKLLVHSGYNVNFGVSFYWFPGDFSRWLQLNHERFPASSSNFTFEVHQNQFLTPKVSTRKLSLVRGDVRFIATVTISVGLTISEGQTIFMLGSSMRVIFWFLCSKNGGKVSFMVCFSASFHLLVTAEVYQKFDTGIWVLCFNRGDTHGYCYGLVHYWFFVLVPEGGSIVSHILNNVPSIVYLGFWNPYAFYCRVGYVFMMLFFGFVSPDTFEPPSGRRGLALCAIVKSSLMALSCLLRSGFTAISSLLSLSRENIQMLVSGRQDDEVLFESKGGGKRANVEVRAVTAASTKCTVALVNTEGRIHAIYVSGEGYKTRVFLSLLTGHGKTRLLLYTNVFGIFFLIPKLTSFALGYENPNLAMDFCLFLLSPNCSGLWPAVPTIMHSLAWIACHAKPCRKAHVSRYEWSHENSLKLHHVELSINFCKLLSTVFKGPGRIDAIPIPTLTVFEDEQHVPDTFQDTPAVTQIILEHDTTMNADDLDKDHPPVT